jgi:hypothetical protein
VGVAPLEIPKWNSVEDSTFIGLPQGCALGKLVRKTALSSGTVRFVAPPGGSELFMAVDTDGNDVVERAGILDAEGRAGAAFPWNALGAPPGLGRQASGFFAVRAEELHNGRRRALLWRPPDRAQVLVEGDHLDVADTSCTGSKCAVLTTLASASAAAGATLLVGDPAQPTSTWRHTDFSGGDSSLAPFSIVSVGGDAVMVALTEKGAIEVFRAEKDQPTHVGTIPTPLGAYDVLAADVPIAVAPGESIDAECNKDGFTVKLLGTDGRSFDVDGQVPPETVVARRLDGGFIVGWLSPTRCRVRSKQMVRAFLFRTDGSPATSTMAVTEAEGFAMSTHGSELDLWLARRNELIWAKATCLVPAK